MMEVIKPRAWQSKAALFAELGRGQVASVVLGADSESPRKFYSFEIAPGTAVAVVGVISSGFGIEPVMALLDQRRWLVIGHDRSVSCLEAATLKVAFSKRLSGAIYQFLPVVNDHEIVVLHELGLCRFGIDGSIRWEVTTDVIESSTIDSDGNVILTEMDREGKTTVSLNSGKVSRSGLPKDMSA
jgi:hypothetical protein